MSYLVKDRSNRPAALQKKGLWHWCFPENFVKFKNSYFTDCFWKVFWKSWRKSLKKNFWKSYNFKLAKMKIIIILLKLLQYYYNFDILWKIWVGNIRGIPRKTKATKCDSKELRNCNPKCFVSATKIGENVTNILNCYMFLNKYTLWYI